MSQNLTPEKRPDRNGNLVTRWVSSFSRTTAAQPLPAPPAPVSRRTEKVDAARAKLVASGIYSTSNASRAGDLSDLNLRLLLDYSPELFEEVMESVTLGGGEKYCWQQLIMRSRKQPGTSRDQFLLPYRCSLIGYPMMHRMSEIDPQFVPMRNGMEDSMLRMDGLMRTVLQPVSETGTTISDETIEAVAMFVYLGGLYDTPKRIEYEGNSSYADNERDIEYLASRIEEVRGILPLLAERKTISREVVESLLDAPSTSLRDGIL
jgi:hypothetical protein